MIVCTYTISRVYSEHVHTQWVILSLFVYYLGSDSNLEGEPGVYLYSWDPRPDQTDYHESHQGAGRDEWSKWIVYTNRHGNLVYVFEYCLQVCSVAYWLIISSFGRNKEFLKHLLSSWRLQLTLQLTNTMKNGKAIYFLTLFALSYLSSLFQIERVWRGHASGH